MTQNRVPNGQKGTFMRDLNWNQKKSVTKMLTKKFSNKLRFEIEL